MRWWLPVCLAFSLPLAVQAADKWTEYNLGPFYVDTDGDNAAGRSVLTQLEQTRWVMEGLLEIKDLNAAWPIRVMVSNSSPATRHFYLANGYYLLVCNGSSALPLGELAELFLAAHTPRLPAEVELGLSELFDTLKANGSHVNWGGAPPHADLPFARMQLFATKFEYGASFHIFVHSLRSGSTMRAAEHNAFGKDADALEKEAADRLANNVWEPKAISGRPLDPKRDFGEHSMDSDVASVYCSSALVAQDPNAAEASLKRLLNEGGAAMPLVFESLALLSLQKHEKPDSFLDDAMHAGSKNAATYVQAAVDLPSDQALPLLKRAADLNPRWAEPLARQAEEVDDLNERETLLKKAIALDQRSTDYWIALARTQMKNGHSLAAESSWLRAEDAAPDESKRSSVQHLHESMESERLDAAAVERRHEKDEVRLADERAQHAETDRIKAAEERANNQTKKESNSSKDGDIVEWSSLVKPQKTYGYIVMVDCLPGYMRVAVRDLRGKTRQLLYQKSDQKMLSCDGIPDKHQVVVTFRPHDDDVHRTDGDIIDMAWR